MEDINHLQQHGSEHLSQGRIYMELMEIENYGDYTERSKIRG